MTFTIEQLKELKNSTTPGPWLHTQPPYSEDNPPEIFAEDGSLILEIGPRTDHISRADENLMFAASVPELLDQLIAEMESRQKLRHGIEALRESYTIAQDSERRRDHFSVVPYVAVIDEIHRHLTQILEENK